MEREVLFRGKRTDNNEWVYGNLLTMDGSVSYGERNVFSNLHIIKKDKLNISHFCSGGGVKIYNNAIQIKKETSGQYTGLKDKNGTKIFEGDICEHIDKDNYPRPFAVEWIEDYACFAFVDKGDYSRNYYFQKNHMENIQVVGNIYNNKPLLK